MGKIIGIIAVVVVVVVVAAVLLFGKGLGKGGGNGDGEGKGNAEIVNNDNSASNKENEALVQPETEETSTEELEENAFDQYEGAIYKITVTDNDYFHDNERIALDDFILIIKQVKSDEVVVEIKDDNASRKAYRKLIERLNEEKIKYVEK